MNENLTYTELASRWKISRRTLERLVKTNKVPSFQAGSSIRFNLAQIEAFERRDGFDEVSREYARDLIKEFGLHVASQAIQEGLSESEARQRFDQLHREELDRLTINIGGNRAMARQCLVAGENRRDKVTSVLRTAPTNEDIFAAAERQRGPRARRPRRPPA